MKTIFTFLAVLVFGLTNSQEVTQFVEKQLIVKLNAANYQHNDIDLSRNSFGIDSLDELNTTLGLTTISAIGQHHKTRTFLLQFSDPVDVNAIAMEYQNLGVIEYAQPNFIASAAGRSQTIPNDTNFNKQWGFHNNGTMTGIGPVVEDADSDFDLAWDIQTGDPDMIIAVVDGGARMAHPDFAGRLWVNPLETDNGVDDDGNGLIDDINGWDYYSGDNIPNDQAGHGMNVAGIIGATANNSSLFVGGNWNSKIMVLKVLDPSLNCTYADMASAVYYAADNGAKILNMSIGGGIAPILEDFVVYANNHNMIITASMMNFNNNVTYYPAGYSATYPNVIAVGATSANDYRTVPFNWSTTSGSNFGTHNNVVAPGSYIYNLAYNSNVSSGVFWSGTSMAAPLVASLASLLLAELPTLTPLEVRNIIQQTSEDQVGNPTEDIAGFDQYMGHGRVNAFAALQAVQALKTPQFVNSQELKIINPVQFGVLEIFSMGRFPGIYKISVNSMDGKLLQESDIEIIAGTNSIKLDYPVGSYIFTFKGENYSKVFKVVIQ